MHTGWAGEIAQQLKNFANNWSLSPSTQIQLFTPAYNGSNSLFRPPGAPELSYTYISPLPQTHKIKPFKNMHVYLG